MKRLLNLIVLAIVGLLMAPVAFAQTSNTPFPTPFLYAKDYGNWGLVGQQPNTYVFFGNSTCNQNAPSGTYFPFATNAKVVIVDKVTANTEVVTPSSIVKAGGQCGIIASTTNAHYSFTLRSATGGLQEALNTIGAGSSAFQTLVVLDRNWYVYAAGVPGTTPVAIIAAAAGNANVTLQDITTSPFTFYDWNGTKFVATSGSTGGPTAPAVTLSTGAGTGATAVINGNGSVGIVNLTTGSTPTASALVYTLTFPSVANGGFAYQPTCTTTSVGATPYTSGVTASTLGPPATSTFTASATALTASTATYSFRYSCQ